MSHADLKHPRQPVYLDEERCPRFKPNAIVMHLLNSGTVDLEQLAGMEFSDEDRRQFAQITGNSVSEYGRLPYGACDENLYLSDGDAAKLAGQVKR